MAAPLDKYYTRPDIAAKCVSTFRAHVPLSQDALIVEPSAGNGAFLAPLAFHEHVTALDIAPEREGIEKRDFFTYRPNGTRAVHVVGNPPFGRNNTLARAFVRHASTFASSVSFILPISWSKPVLQAAFPRDFHLVHQKVLPEKAFVRSGEPFAFPCVFQVWVRKLGEPLRALPVPVVPVGYRFVGDDEPADVAVRRAGRPAGKMETGTVTRVGKRYRHHTRRCVKADSAAMLKKILMAEAELRKMPAMTAGPRTLSMDQIAAVLNKYTTA